MITVHENLQCIYKSPYFDGISYLVLILDEIEGLFGSQEKTHMDDAITLFQIRLEELTKRDNMDVIVVCCSNRPHMLSKAILQRYVQIPINQGRYLSISLSEFFMFQMAN